MTLRIALLGASGMIGSRILAEARRRGHHVTPLGRAQVDALDAAALAKAIAGHDVLVNAYAPPQDAPHVLLDATRSVLDATERAGIPRVVAIGGAGSLKLPDGRDAVETFPRDAPWLGIALAHRDALKLYRDSDAPWTILTPNGQIAPGERTGTFRLGRDDMLFDAAGNASISAEDYAAALVDELERREHLRARFVVGY